MNYRGALRKMKVTLQADGRVGYHLPLGEDSRIPLVDWLGHSLTLVYQGEIHCIHCGRKTSKSFNQGYCFPCFRKLARCDRCIVKPELCHHDQGTCREPEWARANCFQPHVIYLANASDLKVGITRKSQLPTRWIDQGATQALPILEVTSRYLAGLVEVVMKRHVSDRTHWQKMLKGEAEPLDLSVERDRLLDQCGDEIQAAANGFGPNAIRVLSDARALNIRYPILEYPSKVKAFNFDKQGKAGGALRGIKGQYLIFDQGVVNVRKFAGYEVALKA
ncbi:MAG: DUF2797 domain-containing protein [Methylothermaceae bacterium]|nr:DUF2797 domain-containing protein [Methylothermaceae bacterium]